MKRVEKEKFVNDLRGRGETALDLLKRTDEKEAWDDAREDACANCRL